VKQAEDAKTPRGVFSKKTNTSFPSPKEWDCAVIYTLLLHVLPLYLAAPGREVWVEANSSVSLTALVWQCFTNIYIFL